MAPGVSGGRCKAVGADRGVKSGGPLVRGRPSCLREVGRCRGLSRGAHGHDSITGPSAVMITPIKGKTLCVKGGQGQT